MTETTQELLARLTGFTPGPWRDFMGDVCADDDDLVIEAMNRSCGTRSSVYSSYKPKSPVAQANAALIAAAPDLHRELTAALAREAALRALANELSWSPKTRDISNRILAALAVQP